MIPTRRSAYGWSAPRGQERGRGPAGAPSACSVPLPDPGRTPRLFPQVRVPVLLVWGEADPWEPCSLARSLASFPAVEAFEAVPGAGHCVHDERPAEVNCLVLRFLEAHAAPRPMPDAAPARSTEPC